MACPVADCSSVSTRFGVRAALGGGVHTGVDFPVPTGTAVRSPWRGVVRRVWWDVGGGRMVAITHDDRTESRFAHLSRAVVRAGDVVDAGELVAYSGATGTLVTGANLHYELHVDGAAVDPLPRLTGSAGNVAAPPWQMLDGQPPAFPRDAGASCPAGYVAGTVNPRGAGWIPGSPWFGRPTNPDGTVNACVRADYGPGDVTSLPTDDQLAGALLGPLVPVAANVGLIVAAVLVGWGGIRRILDG